MNVERPSDVGLKDIPSCSVSREWRFAADLFFNVQPIYQG